MAVATAAAAGAPDWANGGGLRGSHPASAAGFVMLYCGTCLFAFFAAAALFAALFFIIGWANTWALLHTHWSYPVALAIALAARAAVGFGARRRLGSLAAGGSTATQRPHELLAFERLAAVVHISAAATLSAWHCIVTVLLAAPCCAACERPGALGALWRMLDPLHEAYRSVLEHHAVRTNPAFRVAADLISAPTRSGSGSAARARRRWHVGFTLVRNPQLVPLRRPLAGGPLQPAHYPQKPPPPPPPPDVTPKVMRPTRARDRPAARTASAAAAVPVPTLDLLMLKSHTDDAASAQAEVVANGRADAPRRHAGGPGSGGADAQQDAARGDAERLAPYPLTGRSNAVPHAVGTSTRSLTATAFVVFVRRVQHARTHAHSSAQRGTARHMHAHGSAQCNTPRLAHSMC